MLIRCTGTQSHGGMKASIEMFEDDSNVLMDKEIKVEEMWK